MLGETMFIIMKCQVDWVATGAMLQGIGAIIGSFAVIIAACLGSDTYNKWRKQKISERKIDYAERILTSVYKVRQELRYLRNSFMSGHELYNAEEKLKESGEWDKILVTDRDKYKTLKAIYNRLDLALPARKELEDCYPIARALFGEELDTKIQELNQSFHTIKVYAEAQSRDNGNNMEFSDKIGMYLWEGYPSKEKDVFTKEINDNVKVIERICLPVIKLDLK